MVEVLKRTLFGDPILRRQARRLSAAEIAAPEIQNLIADMYHTLETKKYSVGLAAPQVGRPIALSVIWARPLKYRPDAKEEKFVIINPEIVETYGRRTQKWEGCMSFGTSSRDFPYAKALRYSRVRVRFLDETGKQHEKDFDGLLAHVLQHETDHLNGILFVEHVRNPKTFVMKSEYVKHILPAERKKKQR
ncbi:MAG TPA: peptide deformylase [Candidatus Saccharimonadales bacterium]|jgi:peptide deformylase